MIQTYYILKIYEKVYNELKLSIVIMIVLSFPSKFLTISVMFNDSWCTLFTVLFIYNWLYEK
jgi:hypothetical protein